MESGPDADTPRPVGVGLLLCMLERGGEEVAQALVSLTAKLQVMCYFLLLMPSWMVCAVAVPWVTCPVVLLLLLLLGD